MPLVLEDRLLSLIDLPVQLPQITLPAGGWISIATVRVEDGQSIDLRWMQVYIAALENNNPDDVCGAVGRNVINPSFESGSIASLFLVKDWSPAADPWGQTVKDYLLCPYDFNTASKAVAPIMSSRPLTTPLQITEAGVYTFVLLNNTTNRNIIVTVDGSVTIDTDMMPT